MGGAYNVSEEAAAQISYEPPRNILNNPPAVVQPDIAPQVNVNGQEPQQRRFPNIIQDEQQENRDWLDILYSMSRLMVLLCLVYFYSSPIRCLVVIMIGVALYL